MQMSSLRVGIIGASGYTGAELLRLVAGHPTMDVVVATGDSMAGRRAADVYPSLEVAYPDLVFEAFDPAMADGLDVAFLGLPHEASMALAPQLVGSVGCVVDLSAAYRLKDASAYPTLLRLRTHATRTARRSGVRPARTASDGAEGGTARRHTRLPRHRGHAGAPAARRRRPRRADGDRRQHRHRHHRGWARPDRHERVHQHRLRTRSPTA